MGTPSWLPDRPEDQLYVPREFEHAHLEEARRTVAARNRRPPGTRRLRRRPWRERAPLEQARLLVEALHAAAAAIVIVLAALTGTWLVALFVLTFVAASRVVAVWVVVPAVGTWVARWLEQRRLPPAA